MLYASTGKFENEPMLKVRSDIILTRTTDAVTNYVFTSECNVENENIQSSVFN